LMAIKSVGSGTSRPTRALVATSMKLSPKTFCQRVSDCKGMLKVKKSSPGS
jgi:hypothetical protein